MKRTALFLLGAMLLFTLAGCKKQQPASGDPTPAAITPQPKMGKAHETPSLESTPDPVAPTPENKGDIVDIVVNTPTPVMNLSGSVQVTDSACYALSVNGETLLYGAVQYQNMGETNIILTNVSLSFTWAGGSAAADFVPALASYDIVKPGETGYLTYYEAKSELAAGAPVSMTASIRCTGTALRRKELSMDHLYLAHNYPLYATLTGTISSHLGAEEACSLNMVYVAFYNESGKLLGVWNFTRNAVFEGEQSKNFAEQMKALTIPDLELHTASMRATGYGF